MELYLLSSYVPSLLRQGQRVMTLCSLVRANPNLYRNISASEEVKLLLL